MRKALALLLSLSLLAACGTQDYATRPNETDTVQPAGPQSPKSSTPSRVIISSNPGQGYVWRGLEWLGVDSKTLDKVRCQYGDAGGVRNFDSWGATLVGGALIGVVVRFTNGFLFGMPMMDDGHGPNHHGPTSSVPSFFKRLSAASQHLSGAALNGALIAGICETALAGSSFLPYDGILGPEFTGLSTGAVLGIYSGWALKPWVYRLFGEAPPKTAESQATPPPKGQMELDLGLPSTGAGSWKNLLQWPPQNDFIRGAWYGFMPGFSVLALSTGVGLLFYNKLYDENVARTNAHPLSLQCDSPAEK